MKVALLGDTHCPYQDDCAVDLACLLLEAFEPDEVIHLADGVDFYALSPFDRDPDRVLRLQDELDVSFTVNKRLKSTAPDASWIYLSSGNHEKRLWRYLTRHPEICGLRVLKLESLLRLDELGWALGGWEREYLSKRLVVTHGEKYSKHAGWGVKRELETRFFQQSVAIGHTHKIGCYTARGPRLCVGGWEIGCLCTLEPDWQPNANWMQGMAFLTTSDTAGVHTFSIEQAVFTGTGRIRRTIFRGQEYIAR